MNLRTSLKFCKQDAKYDTEKAYFLSYNAPPGVEPSNIDREPIDVEVHDVRPFKDSLTLENEGFQVINLESQLDYEDFFERNRVQDVFAEELRAALKKVLGAVGIYFHETVIRSRHPSFPGAGAATTLKYEQPIPNVHVDYSPEQLRILVEEVAGIPLSPDIRVRAINVWKPLKGPLRDWPLALCDARTLTNDIDLEPMDSVFPNGCIEGYTVHYNPKQRWCYLSEQLSSEVWIFNTADTGPLSPVAHCAFVNPRSTPADDPRESIEFRIFVVYPQGG